MYALMNEKGYDYTFNPNACEECGGNCCTGESGYIYINNLEIENMAKFLELSISEFKEKYLFKNGYKYSLKELHVENSYDCVFFDREKNGCSVYPVRPTQCRTFPFWSYFKTHKEELKAECPGIIFKETNV